MELKRKKFQGVLNILSFNRHFYVIGIGVLALIITLVLWMGWPSIVLWIVITAFIYGLIMPLLVSAYVYDISGYYDFSWLEKYINKDFNDFQLVNINAGFDETSFIIKKKFPKSDLKVFDFYNPESHTEPAIIRARKVSLVYPNTLQIAADTIPLADDSVDILFLLSAAHEIRSQKDKVVFLKECHRVCKKDGKVIMVEHLRDVPNFLAFSIGFTHFFSSRTWQKAFNEAGFSLISEFKFTPFMSIFHFQPTEFI